MILQQWIPLQSREMTCPTSFGMNNLNCFLPVCKVGVSSKSLQKEAAMKFVQYLFFRRGTAGIKKMMAFRW